MVVDAIILAGGRASRLGGVAKSAMTRDGTTLLELAIDALSLSRQIVVVGDASQVRAAAPDSGVLVARESPAFGGPAAAIGAGLDRLAVSGLPLSDFTIVVACDMPEVAGAVDILLAGLREEADGVVAVSPDGRAQHLAAVYSTTGLRTLVDQHRAAGDLDGLSVHALVSGLRPDAIPVEAGSTDDVDTWSDAQRLGVVAGHPRAN